MSEIKMDFEMMQDTISEFLNGANEIDDMKQEVARIAAMLEEGGLIGAAGDTMCEGLRGPLTSRMTEIQEKFSEIARDLQNAIEEMGGADSTVQSEMG